MKKFNKEFFIFFSVLFYLYNAVISIGSKNLGVSKELNFFIIYIFLYTPYIVYLFNDKKNNLFFKTQGVIVVLQFLITILNLYFKFNEEINEQISSFMIIVNVVFITSSIIITFINLFNEKIIRVWKKQVK